MISPLQDALHEFVQASNEYARGKGSWRESSPYMTLPEEERAAQSLARAGDAFESALADFVAKHSGKSPFYFLGGEG